QLLVVAAMCDEDLAPKEAGRLDRVVTLVAAALEPPNAGEQALSDARLRNDERARASRIRRLQTLRDRLRFEDHVRVDLEDVLGGGRGCAEIALSASLGPR